MVTGVLAPRKFGYRSQQRPDKRSVTELPKLTNKHPDILGILSIEQNSHSILLTSHLDKAQHELGSMNLDNRIVSSK